MIHKLLILFLLTAFLIGCGPQTKETVEAVRERKSPSATSSFSQQEMIDLVESWVRSDLENRRITSAQTTGSMLPTIDSRSVILVERVNSQTILTSGDIVGTRQKILHRIHNINGNMYVLVGDSNDFLDEPVHRNDIEWRVVGILYTNIRTTNDL
jgi:hypothetical protein